MKWNDRILGGADLEPYLSINQSITKSIHVRVRGLLAQQLETWPALRDSVAGLSQVRYKKLAVRGSEALAQFNPRRIVSTTARVDSTTIRQRPCFLCPENLPAEEKGIEFGADFIILCNPFPVLRDHLVVTSRRHIPQAIAGNFGVLLDLTRELGAEWFTIYNGPKCGASAPDHLHFQACSRELLPILRDLESWNRTPIPLSSGVESFTLSEYRVNLLIARSSEREALSSWFDAVLARLGGKESEEEPMINLIATSDDDTGWTVIVFPRSKHRPSCYYAEGDAKLTVSPAAIDLAGVLVVPEPEHFARIGAEDVEKIYAEVTLDIE
jgi:ATP adenylyltransferase/5',5'''-P-1,P-4-tetraphosphate phosphorylase II